VIRAGEAAACAGDQDAYVNYHVLLFRDMQGWGGLGLEVLNQRFINYAQQLGLDPEAFTSCLESGEKREQVLADQEYAASLGVNSTPTFFINGEMNVGFHPLEWWEQKIAAAITAEAGSNQ
jgi:protein-disulfide isomerase